MRRPGRRRRPPGPAAARALDWRSCSAGRTTTPNCLRSPWSLDGRPEKRHPSPSGTRRNYGRRQKSWNFYCEINQQNSSSVSTDPRNPVASPAQQSRGSLSRNRLMIARSFPTWLPAAAPKPRPQWTFFLLGGELTFLCVQPCSSGSVVCDALL
jgi:hypothetical protein